MLQKIDIHLTDHCNLNCRGCTHFSSLADEKFLDIDEYEKDMTRLSQLSNGDGIKEIFLLGGEPLLHPKLREFFPITRNLFRNAKIVIITNGILLGAQDDDFWKACRRSGVEIWISAYTLDVNYDLINQRAKDFGVFAGYTSTAKDQQGRKLWTKFKIDPEGKQYWVDSFNHCALKQCAALKHGKIYTCPIVAHVEYFNKQFNKNLEVSEFDCVDIYKIDSAQAIKEAIVKPIPFCRYCKPKEYESCFWERTKKDINEWI